MKRLKVLISILLVAALFSGCSSFRLASSVDELIFPVSPQGNDAAVQNALSQYTNEGYSLKSPSGGEYTSSYIFFDIDNDKEEEAIVFYEAAKNLGLINMAIIEKVGGKNDWQVVYNLTSENADIYSIDFSDLTGDGVPEFLVLWDVIKNSSSHLLSVYQQSGAVGADYSLSEIGNSLTINYYIAVDLKGRGINDVLAFAIDSGDSVSASATLYSYEDGRKPLGKTKLDGHISSYRSIVSAENDGKTVVFADAVKSNGTQMLTEIIMWSDFYDSVVSPFYSYDSGVTRKTTRSAMVSSCDINGDGIIEVPLDSDYEVNSGRASTVDWCRYEGSSLIHSCFSIAVERNDYQVIVPAQILDSCSIDYSDDKNQLSVTDSEGKLVFAITTAAKTNMEETENDDEIMSNAGYSYIASIGDSAEFDITINDLKSMIKALD